MIAHHEITSVIGLSLNFSPLGYLLHLHLKLGKNDILLNSENSDHKKMAELMFLMEESVGHSAII